MARYLATAHVFGNYPDHPGEGRILDVQTGEGIRPIRTPEACGMVRFSPDGRRLVTASGADYLAVDGEARVWDVADGKPVTPPLRHGFPVFLLDSARMDAASSRGARMVRHRSGTLHGSRLFAPMRHKYQVTKGASSARTVGLC